jgi:hypothetical protein
VLRHPSGTNRDTAVMRPFPATRDKTGRRCFRCALTCSGNTLFFL